MALWHQIRGSGIQRLVLPYQNPSFLYAPSRSFAAPAHLKPKLTAASAEQRGVQRLNEAITDPYVRLVTDEGHSVVSRLEALDRARELKVDLVEVHRAAKPPVCKLMDFYKEKFKQEVKEKERSKSTSTLRKGENKEIRFKGKSDFKDLKLKAETVTRLMERGYRVKCTAIPANNKAEEDLRGPLSRLLALLEDVAVVESGPHVVGTKQAYVILRHVKFITKNTGKKVSKPSDALKNVGYSVSNESEAAKKNTQDEEWELADSGSESESETLSVPKPLHQKPSLSKPVLELNREPINSKPQPSVVESNRYAKQSDPNRFNQQRERAPQRDPNHFNQPQRERAPQSEPDRFNQQRERFPHRPTQFDPNQRQFNKSKPVANVDQNKPGLPNNSSSPTPRFGKFVASKNVLSTDQKKNLGEAVVDQNRSPSSPTQRYGNFSATKSVSPDKQMNSKDAASGKPSNTNSLQKSYGIFSKSKAGSSGA